MKKVPKTGNQEWTEATRKLAKVWQELSEVVITARHSRQACNANEALRSQLKADPDSAINPAALLWMGDNFLRDARFEEAIEVYKELIDKYPDRTFVEDRPWAADALEQTAVCYERLGRPESAIAAYEQLIKLAPKGVSEASLHYHIGRIAERAGKGIDAIAAYTRASESKDQPSHIAISVPELARRDALRVQQPGHLHSQPEPLARVLCGALQKQDFESLFSLASSTHFAIGVAGSELQFVEREKIGSYLNGDLAKSKVRADPTALQGSGSKIYLSTDDWNGRLLAGRVFFVLTQAIGGWEWSAIALTQPGEGWAELLPPVKPETNQPLTISIKAPWPIGACFRAGGLDRFLYSFLPVVGGFFFLEDNFSACGYGPGGYHYNAAGHSGMDAFAIDFTRYVPGFPFADAANNRPVLSVRYGIVSFSRGTYASGDPTLDNRIEIDHYAPSDLAALFASIFNHQPLPLAKYRSKYLHLAGPAALLSPGISVSQGSRLGLMDDTGFSALPHLHFSLHDRDLGFMSVRPTPMDGQTLNDWEGGKCICSSNIPSP